MIQWRVETCDRERNVTGLADAWTSLDATLRHNAGGVWTLMIPAAHPQASLFRPGSRVVFHSGLVRFSGPVRGLAVEQSANKPGAVLQVDGVDDTGVLAERVVWPDPTHLVENPRAANYVDTGPAESVLRRLVAFNAGPLGHPDRHVHGLVQTVSGGLGKQVAISERFTNLLEAMSKIATSAGVGFRVVQNARDLVLEVFTPADKTKMVQWSPDLGNLLGYKWAQAAPDVTRALVAGQGVGQQRMIRETRRVGPEHDWGVVAETFVDARDTPDTAELVRRGTETLDEGSATAAMSAVPLSVPPMVLGEDVWLGDRVTISINGIPNADIISQVRIEVGVDGTRMTPTVGPREVMDQDARIFALVKRIGERLNAMERRQ